MSGYAIPQFPAYRIVNQPNGLLSTDWSYYIRALENNVSYLLNREQSLSNVNSVQFKLNPTVISPQVGELYWNPTDETLDLQVRSGTTLQIGQESYVKILNKSGSNFLNGQVVKITGAQGNRLTADLAKGDSDLNSASTIGILTENVNNNQSGFATTSGLVRDIDTSAWNEGDMLYLSPTIYGAITNVKPIAPQHTVVLGWVVRSHASVGSIYVKVDNYIELEELHNVKITSVADNDYLVYDAAQSLWKNSSTIGTVVFEPNINYINKKSGDLDSLYFTGKVVSTSCTDPRDLFITPDGTKMFVLDNTNDAVLYFTIATPFDISTAVYTGVSFSVATQVSGSYGMTFSADGTRMLISGLSPASASRIFQYNLSTAWDISTAVYLNEYVATILSASGIHGMEFNSNGTKLFTVDNANDQVYELPLSTPWDVTTVTSTTKFFTVGQYTPSAEGIAFSDDGTKLYLVDGGSKQILEFTLGSAYDITSFTFTNKHSIATIRRNVVTSNVLSGASGLVVIGSNFYISDYTNDNVYQFTIDKTIINVQSNQTLFQSDVDVKGILRVNDYLTCDLARFRVLDIASTSTFTGTVGFSSTVTMSTTTGSLNLGTGLTTGAVTIGGTSQTGSIQIGGLTATGFLNLGRSSGAQTVGVAIGSNGSGVTKTVNIGTGGTAGSITNINCGSAASTTTMTVNGSFTATTKAFTIDHPTKPNYKLRYGSLESPYHGVQLTGQNSIPKDTLWIDVELPDYFNALVNEDSIRIQLTAKNHFNPMCVGSIDFTNNTFRVFAKAESFDYTSNGFDFYWSLTAERKDVDKLITEFSI